MAPSDPPIAADLFVVIRLGLGLLLLLRSGLRGTGWLRFTFHPLCLLKGLGRHISKALGIPQQRHTTRRREAAFGVGP